MKVAYVYNNLVRQQCDKLPTMGRRATIVQDLMIAYGLTKHKNLQLVNPQDATYEELITYHDCSYINFIKSVVVLEKNNEKQAETFGLLYDCPLLENTYQFVSAIAGASIKAAQLLNSKEHQYVINWFGGWHHAQKAKAEGFCYVNDIVLAVQMLMVQYPKILYIDLDVHHGDGVENAFKNNMNVLTFSIHKCSPGFYPGTGCIQENDSNTNVTTLNVPLLDGISNVSYDYIFQNMFHSAFEAFQPDCMVVQCGADILAGDPLGQCNVTLTTMGKCIKDIINLDKPTIFLGGGGYNSSVAARYWCYLTALILCEELDNDIPEEALFFPLYKPTFELHIDAILGRKDYNTKDSLQETLHKINQLIIRMKSNSVIHAPRQLL